ncbi:MAG TPA: FAD-binding protein [Candidatus Acidoferrum sp.]|nr:FAD-binding protein [Candidatus Acidoferrum sp.]
MSTGADVLIIGAGIAGLCCARRLAEDAPRKPWSPIYGENHIILPPAVFPLPARFSTEFRFRGLPYY